MSQHESTVAVVGDVHGHLQLALTMLARWQRELGVPFEAVLLCGDIGCFTEDSQLDSATRSHAKDNPCELEFLHQWAHQPPAPWLERIFWAAPDGLGLTCPVIMIHGNHEGFEHLESLAPRRTPLDAVAVEELPTVDAGGWIRYLPSGGRVRLASGRTVAGIGGMEAGQRKSKYHPMAYIDQRAVDQVAAGSHVDILITHQGPAAVQGHIGSPTLDPVLESGVADVWFHGHGIQDPAIQMHHRTRVCPLGDMTFGGKSGEPMLEGLARVEFGSGESNVIREAPAFWRDFRRSRWTQVLGWGYVSPELVGFIPPELPRQR
jgi:hypothetical protein